MPYFLSLFLLCLLASALSQWIDYPDNGLATLTHYTLPSGDIAACGCTSASTDYPTAALSQMAYGSSTSYGIFCTVDVREWLSYDALGPACGRCFNLTLLNPVIATPPFFPSVVKFIVVKITDLCPLSQTGWCSGTTSKPNS